MRLSVNQKRGTAKKRREQADPQKPRVPRKAVSTAFGEKQIDHDEDGHTGNQHRQQSRRKEAEYVNLDGHYPLHA
jgi:hypothetical protein